MAVKGLLFLLFSFFYLSASAPLNSIHLNNNEQTALRPNKFLADWVSLQQLKPDEKEALRAQILATPYLPSPISDVNCTRVKYCDEHNICSIICQRGTVQLDPWLVNTIATQNSLSRKQPFCYSQLPGTHNSAISFADGYGNEDQVYEKLMKYITWIDPSAKVQTNDQWFSLTDQLRMGVRMVELDTHWVKEELRIAHCGGIHVPEFDKFLEELNRLSHFFGFNITWDTETVGCSPSLSSIPAGQQRSLLSAFQEIVTWLTLPENKEEFLVIFFDDQPDLLEWGKVPLLLDTIHQVFGTTVFTPLDKAKYSPVGFNLTMEYMVHQLGKRVLFASGADYGSAMSSTVFYKYGPELCKWSEPSIGKSFSPFPNCSYVDHNKLILADEGQIIRIETSEIMYGPFNSGVHFGTNTNLLDEKSLPPVVNCNTNFLSPDCLTPTRVEAMVWTWAPGHPLPSSCTSVDTNQSGRWVSRPCTDSLNYACQSVTNGNQWVLFKTKSCGSGFKFANPLNPYQNQALVAAIKATHQTAAWINYPGTQ